MLKISKYINLLKNDKRGIGAIWLTVVICLMTPIFIFGFIDIPYYIRLDRKIKNTVDDIAASAVTYLNENALREGIALLDGGQAEAYVMNELNIWFGVDCTGATNIPVTGTTSTVRKCRLNKESVLPSDPYVIMVNDSVGITDPTILEAPHIEIIIHKGILEGEKYKSKVYKLAEANKTINIKYPSVVVNVTANVKGLMLGFPVKLMKTGYSQASVSADAGENLQDDDMDLDNGTGMDLANVLSSINAFVKPGPTPESGYVVGFEKSEGVQFTISNILDKLMGVTDISFKTNTGGSLGGGNLRTGCTMSVKDTSTNRTVTYTVIVYGDMNGDGYIDTRDMTALQNHLNGSELTGVYYAAADTNHDGLVNNLDVNVLKDHLDGKVKISQNY